MKNTFHVTVFLVILTTSMIFKGKAFTTESIKSTTTLRSLQENVSCTLSKPWWIKKGFEEDQIPQTPLTDDNHLAVCGTINSHQQTCCNVAMEAKLVAMANKNLKDVWRKHLKRKEDEWKYYLGNFQKMFTAKVDQSEQDLQEMFFRIYGDLYINNSDIFTQFFHQLRGHLKLSRSSRRIDQPNDTVDQFFKALMWKMLTLFPDQKSLATDHHYNKFEMCAKRHMNEVRTFGDNPVKVRNDLQKSFSIAQKFLHELNQGRAVLNNLYKIDLDDQCRKDFTRVIYCQHCSPHSSTPSNHPSPNHSPPIQPPPPCQSSCTNVLASCLQHLQQTNSKWNNYIKTLQSTYTRLNSPILSLSSSLMPLSVKISEAIMNFQENKDDILKGLERMCGMKVKRDVGVQESASRNTRDVHTRIHKHPYRHTDQHRHTNQHRHTSLQNEPHRHTLRHTKRHTRRANQNRRTQISDSPVSVTSHFEKNALTSTNLISHIPSHFCASLDKPHKRIPHDDDLVDSPACWNATLDTRSEIVLDKQRDERVESVMQRLSLFDDQPQDRKNAKKKKKKITSTTTTTTTTTHTPMDEEEGYFDEDEDESGYDDDDMSGYEDDGEEDGGIMMGGVVDKQEGRFPNFNNNNNGFDRINPNNAFNRINNNINNNNNFNPPNSNNNNNFNNFNNKQPSFSHNHYQHNKQQQQQKTFNNNNNKFNSFNKDIMDETQFYKQYMQIITKPPYTRSNTCPIQPSHSFILLQSILLSYFISSIIF